jgi:site-specific DNA-methyltransferase (adenine-specific)
LINDDCLIALKTLPDNSVDSIITDPPYGLTFMGKDWDSFKATNIAQSQVVTNLGTGMRSATLKEMLNFQVWCTEWATECLRVLKPGGHLLSFGGTKTAHRMICAVEDAGFEIRDTISWIYKSGFPKSLNIGDGKGTALKPAHEIIVMARKPISERNIALNVERWGTGAINIDKSRVGLEPITINGQGNDNLFHGGFSGEADRGSDTESYTTHIGRFPANVIAGEGIDDFEKYFYCPKASKAERDRGLSEFPITTKTFNGQSSSSSEDIHDVEERFTTQGRNNHPTVKPLKLMKYLIELVTPTGGTVLDPFMGSGSTILAAKELGYDAIGIEKDEDYFKIAQERE